MSASSLINELSKHIRIIEDSESRFFLTLIPAPLVYFALRHMYGSGSDGLFAPKSDSMSICLLVLGISSFLFHASLRHTLQFADELAMLGLAWSLLQGTLTARHSTTNARLISICLAVAFSLFSIFYIWTGKIIYHATAFAAIMVLLTLRVIYLFHWLKPELPEAKRFRWRARRRKALLLLIVGYVLWNVDLEYCTELRNLRESVGLPWAWLFELHGWWHILTAISASRYMDIFRELEEEFRNEKSK